MAQQSSAIRTWVRRGLSPQSLFSLFFVAFWGDIFLRCPRIKNKRLSILFDFLQICEIIRLKFIKFGSFYGLTACRVLAGTGV